ncbi:hypothetical protein GCM10010517_29590 [Streptosporangium fragile]|uniref:Uncharacterized protein n=1 Tax=Streptosporangium fragile TaxID=46186 RepID=A0ABN3VX68_9ACTN
MAGIALGLLRLAGDLWVGKGWVLDGSGDRFGKQRALAVLSGSATLPTGAAELLGTDDLRGRDSCDRTHARQGG